jgi:hypothetical protein
VREFAIFPLMFIGASTGTATAKLTTPSPNFRIRSASLQEWFRGSKVLDASGAPLIVYYALPTIELLKPKFYGIAGEHSYFYFAVSKAWARNFAREVGGGRHFICRFYRALKKVKYKDAIINFLRRRDHKLRTAIEEIPDYVTFLSTVIYRLIFRRNAGYGAFA